MAGQPKKQSDIAKIEAVGDDAVLELLEQGYTTRRLAEHFSVSLGSVSVWLRRRTEAVSRARARGAHALADQALDLADGATVDTERLAKLQIDTRKWLASKWNAMDYGEQRPGLTVNIAAAHLTDLRGLLVAVEQPQQALEVSDAMVIGDASIQGDVIGIEPSAIDTTVDDR
jgi:hypothetical protein